MNIFTLNACAFIESRNVGYTDVIKVCSLAFGNVFPFCKDTGKTVLGAIVRCGSLGEEKMTSDW